MSDYENELQIAKESARSFSALDTPSGEYLGALPNGSGGRNYYYKLNGEYRYDCDAVRAWRTEREKDKEKRQSERKRVLQRERMMYR